MLSIYQAEKEMKDLGIAVSSFRSTTNPVLIGKGRGLHAHLFGGPGTGKTFTEGQFLRAA